MERDPKAERPESTKTARHKPSKFSFARKGRETEKGLPSRRFSSGKPLWDGAFCFHRNTADEHSTPTQVGVVPESRCKRRCNRMNQNSRNVNTLVTVPVCHYSCFVFDPVALGWLESVLCKSPRISPSIFDAALSLETG